MTAFAHDYRRDRITVCADTLGYVPDRREVRPLGFLCKVFSLPHLRAVVYGRGQMWLVAQAVAALQLDSDCVEIEDAAALLPGKLRKLTAQYAQLVGWQGNIAEIHALELTLAGYSQAEGRMRLWQFASYENYKPHNENDSDYGGPYPWPILPVQYRPRQDPSQPLEKRMIGVIQAIDRYFVAEPGINHGQRVGGEITLTEVTPDAITSRVVFRFPNYEQVRHAAAAVSARMQRGQIDGAAAVRKGLISADEAVWSETGLPMKATIGATRVAPMTIAAPAHPMSRQERRRLEREARKRVA